MPTGRTATVKPMGGVCSRPVKEVVHRPPPSAGRNSNTKLNMVTKDNTKVSLSSSMSFSGLQARRSSFTKATSVVDKTNNFYSRLVGDQAARRGTVVM